MKKKERPQYTGRKVWKAKGGWKARVYVLAEVCCRKTRQKAIADLRRAVWEMECGNRLCCDAVSATYTAAGTTAFSFVTTKQ